MSEGNAVFCKSMQFSTNYVQILRLMNLIVILCLSNSNTLPLQPTVLLSPTEQDSLFLTVCTLHLPQSPMHHK